MRFNQAGVRVSGHGCVPVEPTTNPPRVVLYREIGIKGGLEIESSCSGHIHLKGNSRAVALVCRCVQIDSMSMTLVTPGCSKR
jgi:hypothetical protein